MSSTFQNAYVESVSFKYLYRIPLIHYLQVALLGFVAMFFLKNMAWLHTALLEYTDVCLGA